MKEGYRFSNGYTATKENATAMRYHELGHVILYLRNLPFSHGESGVDSTIVNSPALA